MAFSYTINRDVVIGGPLHMLVGTWSGLVGDAPGTLNVSGIVYACDFYPTQPDNVGIGTAIGEVPVGFNTTSTNGTNFTTITVYNQANVTNGTFMIVHTG